MPFNDKIEMCPTFAPVKEKLAKKPVNFCMIFPQKFDPYTYGDGGYETILKSALSGVSAW